LKDIKKHLNGAFGAREGQQKFQNIPFWKGETQNEL
jgi:hypothetical protein